MGLTGLLLKNIKRNVRRNLLTSLSLTVASFTIAALHGYMEGAIKGMKDIVVKFETGHIMIAHRDFFKRRKFLPVDPYIEDPLRLKDDILKMPEVEDVTMRIPFIGFIVTKKTTLPGFILGIEDRESKTFYTPNRLVDGTFNLHNGVILGKGMAEKLNISSMDTVTITTQITSGKVSKGRFMVSGIMDFKNAKFNNNFILMSLEDAERLTNMKGGVSTMLIFLKRERYIHRTINRLKLPADVEAKDYKELIGPLSLTFEISGKVYYIIYIMIVILASFTIVNTMLMAIFERMREIGILKAIGMTDGEIFLLFSSEGTLLGTMGGLIGSSLGWFLSYLLSIKGINFESISKDINFPVPYIIRPDAGVEVFMVGFLITLIVSAVASAVPALYASRLTPHEALRSR